MKRFALMLLAAGALLGCRKEDDVVVCPQALPTLAAVMSAAAPPVQSFPFNLGQAQTLRTSGGATLAFGANAFYLPNGTVATGQATVRMREIYSVADMVLADMPTNGVGYTGPLVSAGELNIQVWQGPTRLQWNPRPPVVGIANPELAVPVPQTGLDTIPMRLWQLVLDDSTQQRGWQPALVPNGGGQNWPIIPARNNFYTAALPFDSISWLNFDQYWGQYRTFVGVEVRVPAGASETKVYFRPLGYTSLARATAVGTDPTRWAGQMPAGVLLQAVVLQVRDNQLYYGTQQYVPQSGAAVTPPLEALSAAEIVRRIRLL